MFSSTLNFLGLTRVVVPVLIVAMAGFIWWQDGKIDSKDREIKNLEANITQCESKIEAKSFESKWADEFNSAWSKELDFSTQNESKPKGSKDEKSNATTNNRNTFYDTF